MAARKQKAELEVKRFEDIIAERMPKEPTTRERLAAAVDARAESRAKIDAQAKDKKRLERKKAVDRIAARHHGRRSSKEFLREVAAYDRSHA